MLLLLLLDFRLSLATTCLTFFRPLKASINHSLYSTYSSLVTSFTIGYIDKIFEDE